MTTTRTIDNTSLRNLRGMIIDRDAAWRADPQWSDRIDAQIQRGIEHIDAVELSHIYCYLRNSRLPGTYETRGLDEAEMARAWRKYLKRHKVQPAAT